MEFLRSQFTKIPKLAPVNLSKSTVLITGANSGIGLEAAKEILLSKPERLILAVRNLERGNAARKELERVKTPTSTQIDVRMLDYGSFDSVRTFVKELEGQRVDIAILNAGVWNTKFTTTTDGYESDLQVNVLAPALLSLLLLPNLRAAAAASSSRPGNAPKPHLSIVSSGLYEMAKFPERNLPSGERLNALNDPNRYVQSDRYPTSKVINLLWVKELASRVSNEEIIVNAPTPGFCKTELMRDTSGVMGLIVKLTMLMVGREASEGARCIVEAATVKEEESHGRFLGDMKIKAETAMVTDEEGEILQKDMWKEIMDIFAKEGLSAQVT